MAESGQDHFPRGAWPYLALLVAIIGLKLINGLTGLDSGWVLKGEQVVWKPLTSPGIALIAVNLILLSQLKSAALWGAFVGRAKRPLLTIFFFLLMSQLLVKAGFLDGVRSVLASLNPSALAPLVAGLGGLAGYITGSNVGGNAIFMPSIAHLDLGQGLLPILAAVQNSAAGHAALGSMPIVSMVLGLAKGTPQEEQSLIRFAFWLALANICLVGAVGVGLLYWQGV